MTKRYQTKTTAPFDEADGVSNSPSTPTVLPRIASRASCTTLLSKYYVNLKQAKVLPKLNETLREKHRKIWSCKWLWGNTCGKHRASYGHFSAYFGLGEGNHDNGNQRHRDTAIPLIPFLLPPSFFQASGR